MLISIYSLSFCQGNDFLHGIDGIISLDYGIVFLAVPVKRPGIQPDNRDVAFESEADLSQCAVVTVYGYNRLRGLTTDHIPSMA